MIFNYKIRSDCEKAKSFLLANNYDGVYKKLSAELIRKYIHKNFKRIIFTLELLPPLKSGVRILEIGAMPFCFSTLLMETFSCQVTTIDLPQTVFSGEPYKIEREEIEIPNSMTHKNYNITSWTCNAERDVYPFREGAFDLVICTEVLEHLIYSPSHVFKESWRVLKDGGLMLMSTVNSLHYKRMVDIILNNNIDDTYSLRGPYGRHNRNYTRTELIQLALQNDFKVKFFKSASLKGARNEVDKIALAAEIKRVGNKENRFCKKFKKNFRKIFLNLVKCIIFLPLPGMKDKRHYNLFVLLEKQNSIK